MQHRGHGEGHKEMTFHGFSLLKSHCEVRRFARLVNRFEQVIGTGAAKVNKRKKLPHAAEQTGWPACCCRWFAELPALRRGTLPAVPMAAGRPFVSRPTSGAL